MLCGTPAVKLAAASLCLNHHHREVAEKTARKSPKLTHYSGNFMPQNSAFNEHKDELEHYEQMFGRDRGRLAVSLDRLTNALVLVGQHGVYCTSQRNPTVPAMDLRMVVQELSHAKELVQSVMEELKKARGENGGA
jgi:hypothetical protein